MAQGASITHLLMSWGEGDRAALEALAPEVDRQLRNLARNYLRRRLPGRTLQPTALVNEAWLRLVDQSQPPRYENRAHFFGIAARLMRLILVDYARAHRARKRGGGVQVITLQEATVLSSVRTPDVIEVSEALDQLAKTDERKAKAIELRYFAGMNREEIAIALNLSVATVKRDIRLGEAWLKRFLS
jgi:RNA polymerase sigma factor (TIGR02999 family)